MGYTKGTMWNDDLIKERILEVVENLKLDRMPSRQEVIQYYNNSALAAKVGKESGGWYKWAKKLNLSIKKSETGLGKQYEKKAFETLSNKGFAVEQMSQNFPYDLLVNDCVKIDVKTSHIYKGVNGNFYTYNLEKSRSTCDIYLLYAMGEDNDVVYIVPSVFVPKNTQNSIGECNSKYHKFIDKWDYVGMYSKFNNEILNIS